MSDKVTTSRDTRYNDIARAAKSRQLQREAEDAYGRRFLRSANSPFSDAYLQHLPTEASELR